MKFFRALIYVISGLCIGVVAVGIIGALPFPFSLFPLIPIFLSCAIVFRVRPTVFWCLVVAVTVGDMYRTGGFGVGLLSLVVTMVVAIRTAETIVTHRSMVGCAVVAALVGTLWAICTTLFSRVFDVTTIGIIVAAQAVTTTIITALAYACVPLWWKARSPILVHTRTL